MTTLGARTAEEIARTTSVPLETVRGLLAESARQRVVEKVERDGEETWRLHPDLDPELLAAIRTLAMWEG